MIKLPRLLDKDLNEVTRLHPSKVGITENLNPLSTADMTLPDGEPIVSVGDFVELYLPNRTAGIYRVINVTRDYYTGSQSIRLEHGIATMGDYVVPGVHTYIGWDESNPDVTVTGYRATASTHGSEEGHFQVPGFRFNNADGSEVSLFFRDGTILPIIRLTESGYKVPVTESVVNAASHVNGEWDGMDTVANMASAYLVNIKVFNNAKGIVKYDNTEIYPMPQTMYTFGSYSAGTEIEVYGITDVYHIANGPYGNYEEQYYVVNGGYVATDNVELQPGYTIGGETDRAVDQFALVGNSLIATARKHYPNIRWRFGESDFEEMFGYKFENTNLLDAILKLPEKLEGKYKWEFDQSGNEWVVNLRKLSSNDVAEMRINRNVTKLQVSIDSSKMVTCVYPIGADGITISSVNNGSKYLFNGNSENYWHVESIYTTDNTTANALLESAKKYLNENSEPSVNITASALDLSELTGEPLDSFMIGKVCRVALPEYGLTVNEVITSLSWSDVYGAPEKINITLANRRETASGILAKLLRK